MIQYSSFENSVEDFSSLSPKSKINCQIKTDYFSQGLSKFSDKNFDSFINQENNLDQSDLQKDIAKLQDISKNIMLKI